MSKRKSTIIFRHRKGKGGSVSAEAAEREKSAPEKAKKAPQPVVDQQKEG